MKTLALILIVVLTGCSTLHPGDANRISQPRDIYFPSVAQTEVCGSQNGGTVRVWKCVSEVDNKNLLDAYFLWRVSK